MELLEIAKRVKRGVQLLNRKFPTWRRVLRKHQDQFNLADGDCCILGTLEHYHGRARVLAKQRKEEEECLTDGYCRLIDVLIPSGDGAAYGFDVDSINDDNRSEYEILSDLWRAEFEK